MAALLASACGKDKKADDTWVAPQHETVVRQMADYHLTDSITLGDHCYRYDITRVASDSLAKVRDDMDDLFSDNTIQLTLWRDGRAYFDHTFTKGTFASAIDDTFYRSAILDGIRFLRAEPGRGLTFSFAVSYPESDMSMPFLLTITDQGTFSFVKDDTLDVEESDSAYYDADGV